MRWKLRRRQSRWRAWPSTFGETRALDGVDLAVGTGTVPGLLSPTERQDHARARACDAAAAGRRLRPGVRPRRVARLDAGARADRPGGPVGGRRRHPHRSREPGMVGYSPAEPRRCPQPRGRRVLERLGLSDAATRRHDYSGGMRRRLDLARASSAAGLLPRRATTGLDPRSSQRPLGLHPQSSSVTARPCCSPRNTSKRPTAREPHRRHRRRPDDRRGNADRAQAALRRDGRRNHVQTGRRGPSGVAARRGTARRNTSTPRRSA